MHPKNRNSIYYEFIGRDKINYESNGNEIDVTEC